MWSECYLVTVEWKSVSGKIEITHTATFEVIHNYGQFLAQETYQIMEENGITFEGIPYDHFEIVKMEKIPLPMYREDMDEADILLT